MKFKLWPCYICEGLCDLIPFVQLKKREKHFTESKLLQGCFSRFLSCTNGTKSGKALHIFPRIILRTGYQKNAYPNPELEFFHTHLKCIVRKAKTNT